MLWERCGSCHRPGEIGPFSVLEYSAVKSQAGRIVAATRSRMMPPWLPEPGYGRFAGERRLLPEEIERIERWVSQGAVEGDLRDRRPAPRFVEGWQLGVPDLVVELPEPYTLNPGGSDVFRNFVLPVPLSTTRYVRAMEVRPGNARLVHHATIGIDHTRASRRLDEEDPGPGFAGGMFSDSTQSPDNHALGWTPGMIPFLEPADMAWRLERGTDLVVQLHMLPPASGEPELVRMRVGFFLTDTPPSRVSLDFRLGVKTIDIPAGATDYAVEDRYTLPVDVEVWSVYPHAHYLAKDMQVFATLPGGSVTWLVWIKAWDFHWQDQYRFAQPLFLPAGTVLTMRYTYDNSAGNAHNPNRPPARVVYGPRSSDEMADVWLRLLPRDNAGTAILARSYTANELRKNIAFAERMVAEQPRDGKWRNLLGASYVRGDRVQEGVSQLQEAVRLTPRDAEAQNNLGHALRLLGRVKDALAHFREAAQLAPASDVVQLNLANTLQDEGEIEEAIGHFRRAIALNPDAAEAHNNLGVALASRGGVDEAAVHFRQALEIRPDYADAQRNLSQARRLQGPPGARR
ncbi:MAG: hypothetical protein A3H97_08590 [Acidobacteria bacterium RIFCSPLOWO2_02_FULL_65_29]|nr:MAG: hypothetical protein A3H97_08590 [Acidobacteria bacterium RIFCSPLOWO2_02_FULL_65_29]